MLFGVLKLLKPIHKIGKLISINLNFTIYQIKKYQ